MGGGVVKKFEHDCDGCQFLESFYVEHSNFPGWGNPTGGNHVEYDGYFCRGSASSPFGGTLLARYGDKPHEYWSAPMDIAKEQLRHHPICRVLLPLVARETQEKTISEDQLHLLHLMRWFSAEYFSAGWSDGLEYHLWSLLPPRNNSGVTRDWDEQKVRQLAVLSLTVNGWWRIATVSETPDHEDFIFMAREDWLEEFEEWMSLGRESCKS